ncbi:hypothetical protein PHYSODRAFT_246670 [Phytophthora sojae]|uniref:Retrotransposon gag domain-containing protein n=1 Tax=Phytophthora sojae (strain P6497) TaxID=1094619 RepID=G5ADH9_PHYSP|nr:hypothetical protein PHYSODRAFT_246670 [Phytophthora sojae]EGZ06232.1 hypothetical protein PHYSODRAFT_246670 [Phytophthora sojae]|eukprot:XP_009538129.1 hypothetical protein PHYSODRAFT_246670 [Phytophthora sojae]
MALLRRYGERKDKSAAEWRVNMRPMMPGETYADFAAGLRDVIGPNNMHERVLLAQFYRCLDKTTRKLVQQEPKPKTLEEAVEKATEIDDPMDNVAQEMLNSGLPWAKAPRPYLISMAGTTGQTIPGIGGMGLPAGMLSNVDTSEGVVGTKEMEHVALFTNPQSVYNKATGTWDPPPGHVWNGKYWYEPRKTERKRAAAKATTSGRAATKRPVKTRPKHETDESSGDESDAKPRKKFKAAVKQAGGDKRRDATRTTAATRTNSTTSDTGSRTAVCASIVGSQVTGQRRAPTSRSASRVIRPATTHARVWCSTPRKKWARRASEEEGAGTRVMDFDAADGTRRGLMGVTQGQARRESRRG